MHERDIKKMLDSSDPEQQICAIRAAAQLRLFALEGRIAEELGSTNPRIAAAAACAIGELADAQTQSIVATLLGQVDPDLPDELTAIVQPDPAR